MGRGLDYKRSNALWRLITDARNATTADIMTVFFNDSHEVANHNWQAGQAPDENPVDRMNRLVALFSGDRRREEAGEEEDMEEDEEQVVD